MTSRMNSSRSLMYALAIGVPVALFVAGSVLAQQTSRSQAAQIDVSALVSSAEIAKLPVLYVEEPF